MCTWLVALSSPNMLILLQTTNFNYIQHRTKKPIYWIWNSNVIILVHPSNTFHFFFSKGGNITRWDKIYSYFGWEKNHDKILTLILDEEKIMTKWHYADISSNKMQKELSWTKDLCSLFAKDVVLQNPNRWLTNIIVICH